jgi:hypothetical protein
LLPAERQEHGRRAQGGRSRPPRRHGDGRRAEPAAILLLYRKINRLLVAGRETFRRETETEIETVRGGLALYLPGDRPDMLRRLSLRWPHTSLLIVDEAARVRGSAWSVLSPMLAAAPEAHQYGCGIAACGACTIHLDGQPVRSCQTPISDASGKAVTTKANRAKAPDGCRAGAFRLTVLCPDLARCRPNADDCLRRRSGPSAQGREVRV